MAGRTRARRATADLQADLTFERLSTLADARTIARGAAYATSGRVRNLRIAATSIAADVRGSARYRVRLGHEGGVPTGSCTCPVGADGLFCKHCVAVAIVATDGAAAADPVDLRAHVVALGHDRLVALVLELADNDDLLRARLELEAARSAGTGDTRLRERFRRAIDDALVPRDFVTYHDVYDYTTTARTLVETLGGLITDGSADVAIDLTEHAMTVLENAAGYIDDSDGYLRSVAEDIQAVHRAACAAAEVDPVELAGRLFELEMAEGDLEGFFGAASTYADLLGNAGLAEYRRRATAAWSRLPGLAPGDDGAERSKRFRLTHMMETLARLSGDVDAQVEVMAHDLSASWQFVRIGALLAEHGRHTDALAWAERGLAAFGAADHRLIDLLFDLYHQLGRSGEAVSLARRLHDEHPGPARYRDLAAQARRAGTWSIERDPALARLRQAVKARRHPAPAPGRRPGRSWGPPADSSDLVEVLLWEKRADEAWAEAEVGGCSERLWVELARTREQRHPLDAIPIWQRQVERAADLKRNDGYREAVDLLQHIAALMDSAGQFQAFAPYVGEVRARHRPKRNLMALLADRGW